MEGGDVKMWTLLLFGGVWITVCERHKAEMLDWEYESAAEDDDTCILCEAEQRLGKPANLGDLVVKHVLGGHGAAQETAAR